jgi:hypothetical protein
LNKTTAPLKGLKKALALVNNGPVFAEFQKQCGRKAQIAPVALTKVIISLPNYYSLALK